MMQINATLNLSTGFGIHGYEIPFTTSMFPAGEVYINTEVPFGAKAVRINSRCKNGNDIMRILMAVDSMQRQGVRHTELFIPYLPYSRQDRVCKKGDAFSLRVMAFMLIQAVDRIITYDAHSSVALTLMDLKLKDYNNHREVERFIKSINPMPERMVLIAPDAGAVKKAEKLYNSLDLFQGIVYCGKSRVGREVIIDDIQEDLSGMHAVVVDDICDGGRTFIALGRKLQDRNVMSMSLFVSHGIFSNGTKRLKEMYQNIGTTNSINSAETTPDGVKCFNLGY
ncbi:MAG: hypothetical protein DRR06_15200 [Gammaproteobacteria bacterium]|nr:MAG: hypothetical protein DRR06_15200 [Gammaproteobacteria bacterium]